jgi:hypothetical protein
MVVKIINSLLYLFNTSLKNRMIKALKRPVTYILIIIVILYLGGVGFSIWFAMQNSDFSTTENMADILSALAFVFLPSSIISYSKRKGLLFKKCDVHFIFPSPTNPKLVLLFTGIKNFLINLVLAVVALVVGLLFFHVEPGRILLYFVAFLVLESILEGALMVLCFGNEVLPERFFKSLTVLLYALLTTFVISAVVNVSGQGFSFSIVSEFIHLPMIQMIPIIGWNIALIQLIFIGPSTLNIICTVLFIIATIVFLILAYRAKCVGEYYEDAAKFADDYATLIANRSKGIVSISFGKKKKYRQAQVAYKGKYAKAIYYRQLLEYKKSRFFIFGFSSLLCLLVGCGFAILYSRGVVEVDLGIDPRTKLFILPGLISYMVFVFSGYATKWSRELENPYTYLIPDSSLKKLWYATKIEHVRAIIDGVLITMPGAIVIGLTPLQTLLTIFLYVCLMANKLYYFMLADALIGTLLGNSGRTLLKMLLQGIVIGIGVTAAIIGGIMYGIEVGFFIMILIITLLTFLGAVGAATSFDKMESLQ